MPPEALFLYQDDTFTAIEDLIDGYETLNVTGRELLAHTAKFTSVDGLNGSLMTGAQYPNRTIKVTYRLRAKSDLEYREKYARLNALLSGQNLKFYFFDDPDYYFTGIVTEAETPAGGSDTVVSSFTITCSDPFKHKRSAGVYSSPDGTLKITEPTEFKTTPEAISFLANQDQGPYTITLPRGTAVLRGAFKVNTWYTIKPDTENGLTVLENTTPRLELLDLDSYLSDLTLECGDLVSVEPKTALKVVYRGAEL